MLSAFFESLPGNPDWRAELAAAQDIDDISNVFRHVFSETMPPSNSPFFKDTFSSVTISIDQLVPREAADPERVKTAHKYMAAAKAGTGGKRAPVRVIDMGNGKFKVLDGNTTLQALKDLGETDVVVEIKKSLKQQGVKTIDDVYAAAEIALPAFKEWVEAFGAKTGAKVMLRPGLKGKDIAAEKVKDDYKGNASKLLDVVGATLVFDTTAQVAAASSLISKDPAVFRIKNMFESPTKEGYLGIVMDVMIGGHICELHMNTASIIDAKENGLGHDIQKVIRQLKPIAKQEDMGETSILADGFISRLNKISTKVYQAAADSRMSSSNSSASAIANDSETLNAFDVILNALSSSSISSHFAIDLPHMRNTLPPTSSTAYGTSSFSTNSKLRDSISNPPFDTENITRNGEKVNAKVITGRRTRSYLKDNDMLALQYAVVEAKSLVSSHNADFRLNPEFPAELQPRDRTRDLMKGQISYISNTLNPDRLGGSLYASVGSPIVGRDLVVESGNGRTMGIKQRYNKDGATEYKTWIIQNAGEFGLNPEKLAEIQQPVLVRIRLSDEDRKTITERANEADIASMSPMEQAKVDDSRLTAADMESFTPSKEGDIAAASNAGFIANFIEKVGKAEAAGLLTADSRPTKALVDRIQCAIFSKAYADDRLLTLMAEETHPAVKNILTALTAAAPVFAKIRASYPDMGGIKLVDNIIEATRLMVQARDDGDGIEMVLSQMGLFSQIPEETKDITRILNDNIRRSKHLGTVFKLAGERILTFLQNQNQVGLFGKEPPPTASEVITGAVARAAELDPANRQKGIFEDGDEYGDDDDDELLMDPPGIHESAGDAVSTFEKISFADEAGAEWDAYVKQKLLSGQKMDGSLKEIADRLKKYYEIRFYRIEGRFAIKWDPTIDAKTKKETEKAYYGKLLREYFDKHKSAPASVRDFKSGIKTGVYKVDDLPSYKNADAVTEAPDDSGTSAPSEAITERWRLDIREAKTFQDIADVFNREFGVTLGDDPVLEAAQVRTPATVEENIQRGTEAMNRVISKHGNEPKAMYRQDLGWIAFYWGKPGRTPPSFSNKDDMLEWWNSLKDKFGLFKGGYGVSHIIAKRDWEGKYIRDLLGQKGVSVASKLVEVIAKGHQQPSPKDKATIVIDGYAATLALTRFQNDQVWLLSGFKEVAKEDYNLIYESSGVYSFSNMAKNYAYNDYSGHQNMGAEDDQNLYHKDDDVNKIFESVTDTIAQDVTAIKQPWEMSREEYILSQPESKTADADYDKMLFWAKIEGNISQSDYDSRAIRDMNGGKKFWAKSRTEIELEAKDAIRSAKGERADINKMKHTKDFASWRIKSMSRTAKRDIESTKQYYQGLLDVHEERVQEALSEGKPVPTEVLEDYRNSPKIKWRIGIRKAKTFQDIADVFSDVFGVTVDDPA